MSLLSAIVAGLGLGLLLGGQPRQLASLGLRSNALIFGSLGIQLFLFTGLSVPHDVVTVLYLLSGLLAIGWLSRNLRIHGIPCVAAGALSNFLAIIANGGRMPIDAALLARIRGSAYGSALASDRLTSNSSLADDHTRLVWLTDRILIPPPWPLPTVISLGDILIALGVIWLIAIGMRPPAGARDETAVPSGRL